MATNINYRTISAYDLKSYIVSAESDLRDLKNPSFLMQCFEGAGLINSAELRNKILGISEELGDRYYEYDEINESKFYYEKALRCLSQCVENEKTFVNETKRKEVKERIKNKLEELAGGERK